MSLLHKTLSIFQIIADKKLIDKTLEYEKRKIYHYHIRKTGGTSINFSFFELTNYDNPKLFFNLLNNNSLSHRLIANGKTYVSWNRFLINQGKYFYAYSHHPSHFLKVPQNVFTFTVLRDPVKRFISHYNMLKFFQQNKPESLALKNEGKYLGTNILDFANNIPKKHLFNQIYMFSKNLDKNEAADNAIKKCDFFLQTENLSDDLKKLSIVLDLQLSEYHERKYNRKAPVSQKEIDYLREKLQKEYDFIETVLNHFKKQSIAELKKKATEKFYM